MSEIANVHAAVNLGAGDRDLSEGLQGCRLAIWSYDEVESGPEQTAAG